jgi:nucleotide-binding universal stress UspA family protein
VIFIIPFDIPNDKIAPSIYDQMKNVLVPTDFSENSIRALRYAEMLFSAMECNFYLLYVGTLLDTKNDAESFQETSGETSENTKKRLTDLEQKAQY